MKDPESRRKKYTYLCDYSQMVAPLVVPDISYVESCK